MVNIQVKIDKMEKIASQLEDEEIDLDLAIKKYVEAIKLAKQVYASLNKYEEKIAVLSKDAEQIVEEEVVY
jgi:exodeoxyribonuclease VII small subunit